MCKVNDGDLFLGNSNMSKNVSVKSCKHSLCRHKTICCLSNRKIFDKLLLINIPRIWKFKLRKQETNGGMLFPFFFIILYSFLFFILSTIYVPYNTSVLHYTVVCKVETHEPYLPVLVNKALSVLNIQINLGKCFMH